MRNRYKSECYICGKTVKPYQGTAEKVTGFWRVKHLTDTEDRKKRCKPKKVDN